MALDIGKLVRERDSGDDLAGGILSALSAAGHDSGLITVSDLAAVDQLHAGGPHATRLLVRPTGLEPWNAAA